MSRHPKHIAPNILAPHSVSKELLNRSISRAQPAVVRDCLDLIGKLDGHALHIARIMLYTGCRLQEAINIRFSDVSSQGFIFINALKRSVSRVVYYPQIASLINPSLSGTSGKLFRNYNRWRFYRALHNTGFDKFQHSKCRTKMGNMFRVASAEICRSFPGVDTGTPSEFLGHRNPRSTEFYRQTTGELNG